MTFAIFIVLMIGLIRPSLVIRWGEVKGRKQVLTYYGLGLLASFIAFAIVAPPVEPQEKTEDVVIQEELPTEDVVEDSGQEEESTEEVILYDVVKVVDGDTLTIAIDGTNESVRLIGIDTPETKDPRKPVQCFGQEATNKMTELVSGKQVMLEADAVSGERDRYGRLLRYVRTPDGTFVNLELVKQGYAHEYTYSNQSYKYQAEFKQAQAYAQEHKLGLWADDACVAEETPEPATTTTPPTTSSQAPTQPEESQPAISPTPEPTPEPAPEPTPTTSYNCSANVYNCGDFNTQAEAQAVFEACGGTANDIHRLDADGDGRVCESLQ